MLREKIKKKGELRSRGKRKTTVIEELKQRVLAKAAKIEKYERRVAQYTQNVLFQQDQKRFYQELNGHGQE